MNVLGYSGLDASVDFARRDPQTRPGDERMVQGLDAAAALVVDGRVVAAAAEERFNGEKHTNRFPVNAIRYCLDSASLSVADLDAVAHAFRYDRYGPLMRLYQPALFDEVLAGERQREIWRAFGPLRQERLQFVDHHLAHAASAFYPAGFPEALCAVSDGMGESTSATMLHARGEEMTMLSSVSITDSLGILYGIVTRHLGYDFNADEYKVMGLAPYGDPARHRSFFRKLVELHPRGEYRVRWESLAPGSARDPRRRAVLAALAERFPIPPAPERPSQEAADFAAAAQERVEEALLHWLSHWRRSTGLRRLCYAGGVALNATFNGKLIASGLFDEVYVPAGAGDDGAAAGAALWVDRACAARREPAAPVMPFLGPAFSHDRIAAAVREREAELMVELLPDDEALARSAAASIAEDRVVAWFQGGMEFGPRALGNRSILANPTSPTIRDRLNALVKLRESYRPFAPVVLAEQASTYFELTPATPYDFMIATCPVRPEWRERLPGVTHVDGSARVQTVHRERQPLFAALIEAFGGVSGVPVLVNTSFNVRGQPIVATPEGAVATFLATRIDELYAGRFRLRRAAAGA